MTKMTNALKDLDRLAKSDYSKARVFFQMGKYDEALAAYVESDKAWKKMAELFFEKGKGNHGKEFLEKAKEAQSHIGMCLFKLGKYTEALEIVNSAL